MGVLKGDDIRPQIYGPQMFACLDHFQIQIRHFQPWAARYLIVIRTLSAAGATRGKLTFKYGIVRADNQAE
jgi:hypothetical protein